MSFASGYRGVVGGSVQSATNYTDQPGNAVAGMMAFASDLNFLDGVIVGETNGVGAGKGIVFDAATATVDMRNPPLVVKLPGSGVTAATFGGVVAFEEAMQSDENGNPGWAKGRMCRVARPGRAGSRVWVKAIEAVDVATDSVYLVHTAGSGFTVGDFATRQVGSVTQSGTLVSASGNAAAIAASSAITVSGAEVGKHTFIAVTSGATAKFTHILPDMVLTAGTTLTAGSAYSAQGLSFAITGAAGTLQGDSFTVTVSDNGATSIELTNARWLTSADAGGLALLELY